MKYDTMDIPYMEYSDIYKDALEYDDFNVFADHWFVGESDLRIIWETAHVSPHEIRLYTGLSVTEFARWCLVSRRTVEDWELHTQMHGNRYCALMAWRAGMFPEPYIKTEGETIKRDSLGISDEKYYNIFTDAVHGVPLHELANQYSLDMEKIDIIYKTAHVKPKEIRSYMEMTQVQFAKWVLCGTSIVQQWEYGTRKATPGWNAFLAWHAGMFPEP